MIKDIKKNKFVTLNFAIPEVHKTSNSFCRSNLTIVSSKANKKLRGINFVKMFVKFKNE